MKTLSLNVVIPTLNAAAVKPLSTAEYYNAMGAISPRPVYSALDLSRFEGAGFTLCDWDEELSDYLDDLKEQDGEA